MATKIQKAEKAMREAEAAVQADPNNEELKQALADAQAALEELQKPKDQGSGGGSQESGGSGMTAAALKVICRKESFFRCGIQWTKDETIVAVDILTEEQVEQLKAEPMLIVEEVEIEI